MKLIDEWKKAWRMLSVQAMTLAGAVQGAWMGVPEDWKASVPANLIQGLTLALLVIGVVGRLVKQDSVSGSAP
jgi:hypothetical protein